MVQAHAAALAAVHAHFNTPQNSFGARGSAPLAMQAIQEQVLVTFSSAARCHIHSGIMFAHLQLQTTQVQHAALSQHPQPPKDLQISRGTACSSSRPCGRSLMTCELRV